MVVRVFDYKRADDTNLGALLSLFRNATIDTDYMATGEIIGRQTLEKILVNKNLIHFFGYEDDEPVAYCQVIYKADSSNFKSGAKINAFSVLPSWRGRGLGTALLEAVVSSLRTNTHIMNIYLEVVKDNTLAINLYKDVGFEKVGELKKLFTKDGVLMDIEIYSLLVNH